MHPQDISLDKIQVQGSIGCLSSVGELFDTHYLDGSLYDGGQWGYKVAMQDGNEPTMAALVECLDVRYSG